MNQKIIFGCIVAFLSGRGMANENFAYDQAKGAGIVKCLPAVKKLTEFLIKDKVHGAHSAWTTQRTDQQMFTSTIEQTFSDGAALYSVFVAPVTSGECAAAYERISYWDKSCMATAVDVFATFQYAGELNSKVVRMESKNGNSAYLLPAGSGCVSIVKEVIVDGNKP